MKQTVKEIIKALYQNVGKTLKKLAIWAFVIESVATIIAGIALIIYSFCDPGLEAVGWIGFFLAALGWAVAFLLSVLPYCLGEIVDRLCAIERNTRKGYETASETDPDQQSVFSMLKK